MLIKRRRSIGLGGLALLLLLALALLGLGLGLWSKILTIDGVVHTGAVNAEFQAAFTDDDNKPDDVNLDAYDRGYCSLPPFDDDGDGAVDEDGPADVSPTGDPDADGDGAVDEDPPGKLTSCDPKETGAEPTANLNHRYDKDVAECFARIRNPDTEPQPGSQQADMAIRNGYPSYHCTAWFQIHNNGTIPIHLHSVSLAGKPAVPCIPGVPATPYDLDGDGAPDVEICVSGIAGLDLNCPAHDANNNNNLDCQEFQLHPSQTFRMDIDIHVMQTANQNAQYEFSAQVCWHQWNEEIGACPAGSKVLIYTGNSALDEGHTSLKAHYEGLGYTVDYTSVFPASLAPYALVYIPLPGALDDDGSEYYSAAQKAALSAYMGAGGRVVVAGDHSGGFGINTLNDLVGALSGNITENSDAVTPDADSCAPMTDITPDAATAGVTKIDPSATSSLTVGGSAISLARVDPLPFDCGGLGVTNGVTYLARDGRLVVSGDSNIFSDAFWADPAGDGNNASLATALVSY